MTLPENQLPPEEELPEKRNEPAEVEFPEATDLPEDFTPLVRPGDLASPSRARRRRARRTLIPQGDDSRIAVLESLGRRAMPSFEFFLLAILSGILLGAGYLLDSDALLLLGALLAPLLAPWAGMTLGAVTGSWRFFFRTLTSLAVALLLAFSTSALVGYFNRVFELSRFSRAEDHAKLWAPDLLIVTAGAVLLVLAFVRGEERPILPSVLLAYGLFLPVGAAGFGLSAGLVDIWPNGLFVFLTHLALATLVGSFTFFLLKFKPPSFGGYLLLLFVILLCLAALVTFTGVGGWVLSRSPLPSGNRSPTPLGLASPTLGLPPSATPGARTSTFTRMPSQEPSATPTETSAPSYALIAASTGGGALVRTEPAGGTVIATLINGTVVEVLPEIQVVGSTQWVLIRTLEGVQGWVLQTVLVATAAPAPTNTGTPTP